MLRSGPALGAGVVLCLVLGGCADRTPTQPGNLRICGTTIPTGANIPRVARLSMPSGSSPQAPAASQLPPTSKSPVDNYSALAYVQTSRSCDAGAIVVVSPMSRASLAVTALAKDGAVAAVGLMLKGPVTIQAWVAGRYQGALSLNP